MRVVHVVNSLECEALEPFILKLVKALNENGTPSDIICLTDKGPMATEVVKHGIKVVVLKKQPRIDLGLIIRLARIIKKLEVDIVHTHDFSPLIYGTLAAKLAGKKCVNSQHGRINQRTYRFIFIWNANHFIIPKSNDTRNYLLKYNRIATKKLRVIYNGLDLKRFTCDLLDKQRLEMRKELGIGAESFVQISVGRLSPEKDHMTLLKAFRRLRRKKMDSFLLIVGDGPLKEKLKATAVDFEISDRVLFLGFREDIVPLLQIADVFILSSYREGLSFSILEAMACGKPVVATKIGCTPEVVIDDETGYLVPCGFPERIEVAVQKLFINKNKAVEMGGAARRKVEQQFSLVRMVGEYQQLYLDVIGTV